jgi:hypothetical protein
LLTLGLTVYQENVRKHVASLLETPLDGRLGQKVTKDDADGYDQMRDGPPCTADDFKLHLEGTVAHPWNKAATHVFADSFRTKFPDFERGDVELCFKTHVDTLIRKYRTQQIYEINPEARLGDLKENRKTSRKSTVGSSL